MLKQGISFVRVVILIAVVAAAGVILWAMLFRGERTVTNVTIDSIKSVARLATVNCYVSVHRYSEKPGRDWSDFEWLWGKPKVLVLASGCVEGSVDLEKATVEMSDDPDDPWLKVVFAPGAVRIGDPEMGPGDLRCVDVDDCVLYSRISEKQRNEAVKDAQIRLWVAALRMGIVEKTMEEAKTVLQGYLASLGYRGEVTFRWTPEQEAAKCLADRIPKFMSLDYKLVASFDLDGHPYIFGLLPNGGADIWRINDDPSTGCTLLAYGSTMSPNYKFATSFQMGDQPYVLGLHSDVGINIWRVEPDPSGGLRLNLVKYRANNSPNYKVLTAFSLGGHPYIFGVHKVGANVWRVNENVSTGLTVVKYGARWPDYKAVTSFQLAGHPHLLGLSHDSTADIWRIESDLNFNPVKRRVPMSGNQAVLYSFDLEGHPHILGRAADGSVSIWRVNDNATHLTPVVAHQPWVLSGWGAIAPFDVDGRPYLCGSQAGRCPSIWRVNAGQTPGLQLLTR